MKPSGKATVRLPLSVIPFAVGPFSSKNLAAFYYQLGTMIQAGMPIQRALTALQKSAPRPTRSTVRQLSSWVNGGYALSDALEQVPTRFQPFDRHLIGLCEQSGALDTGLLSLSRYHDSRARARGRIVSASIYPVLILVAAVFIANFPALVLGTFGSQNYGMADYLRDTVGFLVVLALGAYLLAWMVKSALKLPALRLPMDQALRSMPLFGSLRFDFALAQWLNTIRLMLNAGYGIVHAIEKAGELIPSPILGTACRQTRQLVEEGMTVSEAMRVTRVFPERVVQFMATGEESGRMDEMLDRLAVSYQEQWEKNLATLAALAPWLLYGLVSLYVISRIVKLLLPLVDMYRDALQ